MKCALHWATVGGTEEPVQVPSPCALGARTGANPARPDFMGRAGVTMGEAMKKIAWMALATLMLAGCPGEKPANQAVESPAAPEADKAPKEKPAADADKKAPAQAKEVKLQELTLLTATKDGNYHSAGVEFAAAARKGDFDIKVQISPGSFHNVQSLGDGTADLAMAQYDTIMLFQNQGAEGQKVVARSKVFGAVSTELIHILVRKGAGIASLADLKGKKVGVGPKYSGSWISAWAVMHYLQKVDVEKDPGFQKGSHAEQLKALTDGTLDAIFITTAPGMPLLKKMDPASAEKISLLSLPEGFALKAPMDAIYSVQAIPPKTYPFQADGSTTALATSSYLLARADLSEDQIAALAKTVYADNSGLRSDFWLEMSTDAAEVEASSVPYHAGVRKHLSIK